jgi:multiple sugar transport system permease protein
MLLDPQYGIIDYLIGSPIVWLGHPRLAFMSVAMVNIWQNAPYVSILLLAGLRSLPIEPVEAASIDGASRWQTFVHVTLPLLRPYIVVALLLRTIFEFRSFDNVYVMTSGGPADATTLLSIYTYVTSFVSFDMSLAAASSWVMLLIVLAFCIGFVAIVRRRDAT